jgi:hypothetical protein
MSAFLPLLEMSGLVADIVETVLLTRTGHGH